MHVIVQGYVHVHHMCRDDGITCKAEDSVMRSKVRENVGRETSSFNICLQQLLNEVSRFPSR